MRESEAINNLPLHIRNELETVLDRFDAVKVVNILNFLDWKWALTDEIMPCDVRATARYLMAESYFAALRPGNDLRGQISTGGLVGRCFIWPGENLGERSKAEFEIAFEAESAESWRD